MSDTLLPCPFCGGEAEIDPQQSFAMFGGSGRGQIAKRIAAYCLSCTADISICLPDVPEATPEMVIEMWNTRTTLQQQASRLDAADKLVERLAKQLSLNHNWHLQYEEDGAYSDTSTLYEKNTEALTEVAKWREGK